MNGNVCAEILVCVCGIAGGLRGGNVKALLVTSTTSVRSVKVAASGFIVEVNPSFIGGKSLLSWVYGGVMFDPHCFQCLLAKCISFKPPDFIFNSILRKFERKPPKTIFCVFSPSYITNLRQLCQGHCVLVKGRSVLRLRLPANSRFTFQLLL